MRPNDPHMQKSSFAGRYWRAACLAAVIAGCLLDSGCALWPWGDDGAMVVQKSEFRGKKLPPSSVVNMPLVDAKQSQEVPEKIRDKNLSERIVVYKISLPAGMFSNNDKIWRLVDEDALDSQTSLMLAQNGMRAAVLEQSRWPAIAQMLQTPSAMTEQFACVIGSGQNVDLMMRPNIERESLFYIDRDLNMQGRTFNQCDNKIRLGLHRDKTNKQFIVALEPLVTTGTTQMVRTQDMVSVQNTSVREHSFENLRMWVTLTGDQALVLTPSRMKETPFSVGAKFLSDIEAVPPREMVLVFVPQK